MVFNCVLLHTTSKCFSRIFVKMKKKKTQPPLSAKELFLKVPLPLRGGSPTSWLRGVYSGFQPLGGHHFAVHKKYPYMWNLVLGAALQKQFGFCPLLGDLDQVSGEFLQSMLDKESVYQRLWSQLFICQMRELD